MEDLIFAVGPYLISFLIGLVIKSPIYSGVKTVMKALEDDKLTEEEMRAIYDAFKKKGK